MSKPSTASPPFAAGEARRSYLQKNRIAVGPPADPDEFHRDYQRLQGLLPKRRSLKLTVLDIGCGTGAWSVHWAVRGCKVTGVDFDPELIARAACREGLTDPEVFTGVVADATRLPADLGNFDVVVLNSLLEHVPDWRATVLAAVRALAPGGLLVLTTTNRYHPFQGEVNHFPFYPWLPGAVRERVLAWIMKHRRDLVNYPDYPAVHWFSYPQLKRVLYDLGLEVYDRLDLMRPEHQSGLGSLARAMVTRGGRVARGRMLFYLLSSTVALYARAPPRVPLLLD